MDNEKRKWIRSLLSDFYVFAVCMAWVMCFMTCTSCTSYKPVVLTNTLHDTTYIDRTRIDSLLLHDSVYLEVFTSGDTVYKIKYVDRFRDRICIKTDTIYATRTDSVRVPVPTSIKVPWLERGILSKLGFLLKILATVSIIFILGWIWLRHRKV